jgi:hypothetical protein
MTSSLAETDFDVRATKVVATEDTLTVEFQDGRTISVPTQWYPRLFHGTPRERKNLKIGAFGIHWPDLDEDISYRGLILGRKSAENPEILKFWLENRKKGKKVTLEDWMTHRRKSPKQVAKKKVAR